MANEGVSMENGKGVSYKKHLISHVVMDEPSRMEEDDKKNKKVMIENGDVGLHVMIVRAVGIDCPSRHPFVACRHYNVVYWVEPGEELRTFMTEGFSPVWNQKGMIFLDNLDDYTFLNVEVQRFNSTQDPGPSNGRIIVGRARIPFPKKVGSTEEKLREEKRREEKMASSRPPPSKSVDLDLTIVSAKHLKNVNWKNGDLKPYVVFWVDPDRRLATKSDDSGCTSPVWNERFALPLPVPLHDSSLTLEIFHSKPSDTPKPLVATLRLPLKDLHDLHDSSRLRKFPLSRPSGRPQGKIHLKLGLLGRPQSLDYVSLNPNPNPNLNLNPNTNPTPPFLCYRGYTPSPSPPPSPYPSYTSYPDSYSPYYSSYYPGAPPPPPPSRPFFDRPVSYAGPTGPSAPLDYSSSYDPKPKGPKMGLGTGLAVGAVAGALGGLALEEGLKYEEDKIAERVENDVAAARDDYSDYRVDY
ncbi:hypothetical protein VNO77_43752 [Canavalia gladiata]|uniref:C2 domain-containing protein n=1 Tax=Canavalia gladiata TaxID=3824 RepID=A0AAN9PN67_CANGL